MSLEDADAITEICRRLDGIPLAIELAASRMQSMSATEVRDRLDDRFRLLVGSRRGLERHQTLRHAVQWSYDLLDEHEKALLNRCAVFNGGFDLAGACAVVGSDDDMATLDVLDALVRKSLLTADSSSGRTRYSMLETIRQFAEDQLAQEGSANDARTAHARYFAAREDDVLALWDSPRQREAYTWFGMELANLRAAFNWATDNGDLDICCAVLATYAAFLGVITRDPRATCMGRGASFPLRRRSTTLGWHNCMCSHPGATRRDDSRTRKPMREQLDQRSTAGATGQFPTTSNARSGGFYASIGQA